MCKIVQNCNWGTTVLNLFWPRTKMLYGNEEENETNNGLTVLKAPLSVITFYCFSLWLATLSAKDSLYEKFPAGEIA